MKKKVIIISIIFLVIAIVIASVIGYSIISKRREKEANERLIQQKNEELLANIKSKYNKTVKFHRKHIKSANYK